MLKNLVNLCFGKIFKIVLYKLDEFHYIGNDIRL
jgi:hypothetical protein